MQRQLIWNALNVNIEFETKTTFELVSNKKILKFQDFFLNVQFKQTMRENQSTFFTFLPSSTASKVFLMIK